METILHQEPQIPTKSHYQDHYLQQRFKALSLQGDRNPHYLLAPGEMAMHDPSAEERVSRMMKDCAEEMRRSWGEMLLKGATGQEVYRGIEEDTAMAKEVDAVTDFEEPVKVDTVPEGLIIHFSCPCGEEKEILFAGSTWYYKLM
ncbi:hypothetical protein Tsubulata_043391 [Turnera subulata]|uniref:Uncharacterized protein n=1 Tax=Turnera subulata TaxID=218843 RepID=A0A9Q0G857_9ROSI|nr:hypothetical protein Tsubulata_043391 [Turnera subulata]